MSNDQIVQAVGWVGSGMLLLAYLLLSCRKVSSKHISYQALNLFGAITAGIFLHHQKAWSMLALEIIWAGIAGIALIQLLMRKWQHIPHDGEHI